MTKYGQFCPIAKSAEMLGDPWTLLIIREMLLGSSRFGELHKGLPKISPTVLNTRLKALERDEVLVRRKIQGQRGHEYKLTPSGRELEPIIQQYAIWGMRWARDVMSENEMDITFLMFDIQRRIEQAALPDGETVLCFQFTGAEQFGTWWLVLNQDTKPDLCHSDPGKDVDLYITSTPQALIEVWMGDVSVRKALEEEQIVLIGDAYLRGSFSKWFLLSSVAGVSKATEAERDFMIE